VPINFRFFYPEKLHRLIFILLLVPRSLRHGCLNPNSLPLFIFALRGANMAPNMVSATVQAMTGLNATGGALMPCFIAGEKL